MSLTFGTATRSYEAGIAGWGGANGATIARATDNPKWGTGYCKVTCPGTTDYEAILADLTADIAVSGNTEYTFSFYVRTTTSIGLTFQVQSKSGAVGTGGGFLANHNVNLGFVNTAGAWQRHTATITTHASATRMGNMRLYMNDRVTTSFDLDGWQLDAGPISLLYDGEDLPTPIRYNYWAGGSIEKDGLYGLPFMPNADEPNNTVERSTDFVYSGTYSLKCYCSGTEDFQGVYSDSYDPLGGAWALMPNPVVPVRTHIRIYSLQAYDLEFRHYSSDANGGWLANHDTETITPAANQWSVVSWVTTPHAAARKLGLQIYTSLGDELPGPMTFYIDAIHTQPATDTSIEYGDGDTENWVWAGNPHLSASYKIAEDSTGLAAYVQQSGAFVTATPHIKVGGSFIPITTGQVV